MVWWNCGSGFVGGNIGGTEGGVTGVVMQVISTLHVDLNTYKLQVKSWNAFDR